MNDKPTPTTTNASGILTGRPTIAANTGAGLSRKELRAFTKTDLSAAEWVRLPAPRGRCRLSGLSRTGLNEAIERGDIRDVIIRKPGAIRGVKLINKASLLAWLQRLDAEQNRTHDRQSAVGQPLPANTDPEGIEP
ncbi:MAG TPA: hypothetical protein PKM43_02890 [Verrucomicrobiota bacterium]|nr:hypothetical protein [Verrucomicrobiota bacterium]